MDRTNQEATTDERCDSRAGQQDRQNDLGDISAQPAVSKELHQREANLIGGHYVENK